MNQDGMKQTPQGAGNQQYKDFVEFTIKKINEDKGTAAKLRRADNPATEYQSWEYLAKFNVLDKRLERLTFATIAAAIAKAEITKDGVLGLGAALAKYYNNNNSDQSKIKLKRLLACSSVEELCRVLRSLLRLIAPKGSNNLSFTKLFLEILEFKEESEQPKIKSKWAQEFYNSEINDADEGH